jgi:hypothetical protein
MCRKKVSFDLCQQKADFVDKRQIIGFFLPKQAVKRYNISKTVVPLQRQKDNRRPKRGLIKTG